MTTARLLALSLTLSLAAVTSAAASTAAPNPPETRAAAAATRDPAVAGPATPAGRGTAEVDLMRVATAASGPDALHAATLSGAPHQHGQADPPAFLLFAAVLVIVVFVSTRRRPDR